LERAPKFWDLNYKNEHTFHHVAKFHVDQPRELEDLAVKIKKRKKEKKRNICSKTYDHQELPFRAA